MRKSEKKDVPDVPGCGREMGRISTPAAWRKLGGFLYAPEE